MALSALKYAVKKGESDKWSSRATPQLFHFRGGQCKYQDFVVCIQKCDLNAGKDFLLIHRRRL